MSTRSVRLVGRGVFAALVLSPPVVAAGSTPATAVAIVAHGADAGLGVAEASHGVAAALGSSRGLAEPISRLATPGAVRLAEEARRAMGAPAALANEILALGREAGVDTIPADVAALHARVGALPDDESARLAELVHAIRYAAGMIEDAVGALAPDEREELERLLTEATDALADDHADANERQAKMLRLDALARRVDLDRLFAASIVVSATLESTLQPLLAAACGVPASIGPPPFSDPNGLVVVGSAGPDTYTTPTILLIELGGDDVYELSNRAGGVAPGDFPISIVVDVDGDDSYHSGGATDVLLT
ncbi:MAG: hypothetical protein ACREQY_07110, partial [Candidatus Binatia bacterium]